MEKQKNTNSLRDVIFDAIDDLNPEPENKEDNIDIERLF